jgi:hypothetical protein
MYCKCQGQLHPVKSNCTKCGFVACKQQFSKNCPFCGVDYSIEVSINSKSDLFLPIMSSNNNVSQIESDDEEFDSSIFIQFNNYEISNKESIQTSKFPKSKISDWLF